MKIKQSRDDLVDHLRVQLRYLQKSAQGFDEGDETEAARLAVTLRVLLHNTKASASLLKQLGVQHQLKFIDTASPPKPPSGPGVMVKTFSAGLGAIRLGGDDGAAFVAPLVDGAEEGSKLRTDIYGPQPFRTWWNRPVLEDLRDERFTRKELVLFLAHKLGGAHVDPELQPRFVALTKFNSLGWGRQRDGDQVSLVVPAGPEDEPLGTPIPVNVRQIAYEVDRTLVEQLAHLLSGPTNGARGP